MGRASFFAKPIILRGIDGIHYAPEKMGCILPILRFLFLCCGYCVVVGWVERFFEKPIILRGVDGFHYAPEKMGLHSTHPTVVCF